MFARMFSWHDLSPLIRVEQRLNSTTYLSIVADQVHPNMLMAYPKGNGFFQQDNAPCHGTCIVQEWFQEHERIYLAYVAPTITRSQST